MKRASPLSRRELWVRLLLYPTHTLPTAAAPVLVGLGLAIHDRVFAPLPALVGFFGSWLLHVGGVFIDNYQLLVRHPKNREHPELVQAIKKGTLSLPVLRGAIAFCYGAALLTAPYLLHVGGPVVAVFGILGIVSSWSYAGGPLAYARLGLADPIFFVMFGVVAVLGTYYIQAAPLDPSPSAWLPAAQALPVNAYVLGLPVGALVVNVLLIDDMRDRVHDRAKGWRTGSVRFGLAWTRFEIAALTAFSYVIPFWFWLGRDFSPWVLLPLLTLPLAVRVARVISTRDRFEDLFPMTPEAASLAVVYAALLAVGIAL